MNFQTEPQEAIDRIMQFLKSDEDAVFILKGAAGTGKTTLLKKLLHICRESHIQTKLMASTGRAAKVMEEKTSSICTTIHLGIYNFGELQSIEVDNDNFSKKTFRYYFPISEDTLPDVIIIDEASMVSNVKNRNELFGFGTDCLLSDLLYYARILRNNIVYTDVSRISKIIFVGDPAQLPPVGCSRSMALDLNYFKSLQIGSQEFELQKVYRQAEGSDILESAMFIRNLLSLPMTMRNSLSLNYGNQIIKIDSSDVVKEFTNLYPRPSLQNGVIINYTNAQSYSYNLEIRAKYFPNSENICAGDIVMIQNNNYSAYEKPIYNGDMALVTSVDSNSITRKIQVWNNGKKESVLLVFRKVVLKLKDFNEIECVILDSLLNSPNRGLSVVETKALYIDFCIRYKKTYSKDEGSEDFKNKLKKDIYFNALRVKYGYAITCHKSQGGEWDTVFVDYSCRLGFFDDALKWCYTATTRAARILYAINAPELNCFIKFQMNPIKTGASVNDPIYQQDNTLTTPYHTYDSMQSLKVKYYDIELKLKSTNYRIEKVDSISYCEKYFLKSEFGCLEFNLFYKKTGIFSPISITENMTDEVKSLVMLLNSPSIFNVSLNYTPSKDLFQMLYSEMKQLCSCFEVQITNIVEYVQSYYVIYYLKTSGHFSYIQFYFNNKGLFSKGVPVSDIGDRDEKLKKIVEHFK